MYQSLPRPKAAVDSPPNRVALLMIPMRIFRNVCYSLHRITFETSKMFSFHDVSFFIPILATVATPKSPRTPTVGGPAVMVHSINHRFTMTFKMLTVCDLCFKQMFIGKFQFAGIAMTFKLIHDFFL